MCVLAKAQIKDLDVIADAVEQISHGSQESRHVGLTGTSGIGKSDMATLPRFGNSRR